MAFAFSAFAVALASFSCRFFLASSFLRCFFVADFLLFFDAFFGAGLGESLSEVLLSLLLVLSELLLSFFFFFFFFCRSPSPCLQPQWLTAPPGHLSPHRRHPWRALPSKSARAFLLGGPWPWSRRPLINSLRTICSIAVLHTPLIATR